jgi:quinol monooxygenase YgiN
MQFVQILEFRTSNIDKIRALDDEWRQATDGKRTLQRSILCQDRNDKNRYLVFAFFDSQASATINSELAETANFANQTNAIVDAPIVFQDLDVVEDRT